MQQSTIHFKRPYVSSKDCYRGRFAPSPSGLLHFGSLIAALASYLDAKASINAHGKAGKWLVRIEDIDPPREQTGASDAILSSLEAFGLHWDESVLYQSQQSELYRHLLNELRVNKQSYFCQCTRNDIKKLGGIYQAYCRYRNVNASKSAVRLINQQGICQFTDLFQGQVCCDKSLAEEAFIIHRKDGLFAYQLAVVHDDIYQNISHVIRGCDLLEPTARQLSLFATLKQPPPIYGHVPVAMTKQGYKLSKQNKATAIDKANPQPALIAALSFLGQAPCCDLVHEPVNDIINWGIKHWSRQNVPKVKQLCINIS